MNIKFLGLAGGISLAALSTVQAVPSQFGLYLDAGGGNTSFVGITGGSSVFDQSLGGWNLIVTVGTTLSGGSNPAMDLQVYANGTQASGDLKIYYSDGNFGPSSGTYILNSTVFSSPGVAISAGYSTTDTPFGNYSNLGGYSIPPNGQISGNLTAQGPYSMTIYNDLAPGQTISLDTSLSVPDGGSTAILLGIALSCMGLFFIRKPISA